MRSLLVAGLVLALAAVVVAGCGDAADEQPSWSAQVYIATVREVVADQPPPEDPEVVPVVYVMTVGESPIAANVQAEVAAVLREETDLRFADERIEAVLQDVGQRPVRDEGVLLAFGELAPDGQQLDVEVEVYRSEADSSRAVMTFAERSSQWAVTSTSLLSGP